MTVLYPYLCNNQVCCKGTALFNCPGTEKMYEMYEI